MKQMLIATTFAVLVDAACGVEQYGCLNTQQQSELQANVAQLVTGPEMTNLLAEARLASQERDKSAEQYNKCSVENADPISVLANLGMACRREAVRYNSSIDRYERAKERVDQHLAILKVQADLIRMKYPRCQ
ncbi:MAG: hypothetical protein IV094_09985 [Vitreoscilla sp.]|nr:hypothetical protein [Vitreoscilla sp.]